MGWQKTYQEKLKTAEEAVKQINSGDSLFIHSNVCVPVDLMEALAKRKDELKDVNVYCGMSLSPLSIFRKEFKGHINYNTHFIGGAEKEFYHEGNIALSSVHLSLITKHFLDVYNVNVLMMEVTAPDDDGYLYFGLGGTAAGWDVAQRAEKIILQVNSLQPKANGKFHRIHISEVTSITEGAPKALPEFPQPEPGEVEIQVAKHILPYIADGSTLQIGLGGLSNAIGFSLEDKKNLSVHTEMYTDSMAYLSKKGVINGPQWAAFALGRKEMYEYVPNGPVNLTPISIINNPYEIAKNDNMISINACMMADLTGQICSESIGHKQYSATGGQLDFVKGAAMSKGGKSFLCLNSSYIEKGGKLASRILLNLPPGAIVTTPRSDVMYVVTEYGVADLFLRSIEDRVNAMISIAHPEFREELRAGAVREGLLRA